MSSNEEAVALRDEFTDWQEEYGIGEFLENTAENRAKLEQMDPHLLWTDHGTCEDEQVTAGYHIFSEHSCCWDNYGWYIASIPWVGDVDSTHISYKVGAYLPCPSCNPDGESEDHVDDCPGDEEFPDCECSDGHINYYWD